MPIKVHLYPQARGEDDGQGGVRRVVEGQQDYLPAEGIVLVDDPADADLIACHITIPEQWLKRWPEKAFVSMVHGLYWDGYTWPAWALKANGEVMEAIRVADAVTAPSEWVANAIRRHTCRDVTVIPHGLDLDAWQPGGHDGYVLWDKTRPDAICDPEPMNMAAKLLPDVKFISTFGEETLNVRITGKLPFAEAADLVRRAGVYLATSRETFGIATLQALACGVPVVGWNWGGQREFIEHGVDGWLVEPGDIVGLADGIQWALKHRDAIIPSARAKAEQYPWSRAAAMYADLFRRVVAARRVPRPRTSVIVTAYGLDKYLADALRSVQAQTDEDWECIVVDDASPDTCGEIADAFAAEDSRFRVVHNETNLYLAGARNTGVAASRGRYILPLDADDMLAPNAGKLLADALDADRATHVAYGNVEFLEEDARRWHSGWPMPFRHDWQLKQRNLLPYSSMIRREALELTGGWRSRCRTAEDADLWCRLSSYGFRPRMVTTEDTLVYRNREDSMSRVEGPRDWAAWFPWSTMPELTPAGAGTIEQMPVDSLDPIIVSVIIPVGPGHERIVMDALDSVDAQMYRSWEAIVVDDTGGSLSSLPSWVRVVSTGQRGAGVARARNIGVAQARAPLYLPLDADDTLEPNCLMQMVTAAYDEKNGQIVYADFWEDPQQAGEFKPYGLADYDARLLTQKGAIHAVTALTPVAIWREVGGYDEDLPGWEDWAFQIKCAERGYCSTRLAAPLWTYRKWTGRRREENHADFEQSKGGILAKYGRYWEGETLASCSTCGARRARTGPVTPSYVSQNGASAAISDPNTAVSGELVLVSYNGPKTGGWSLRGGVTRTIYRFVKGDVKYVFAEDLDTFRLRPDFDIMGEKPVEVGSGPKLVAEGPPVREEAAVG